MDQSNVDQSIRSKLVKGERLIWSGTPRQGVMLRGSDALMIPFSLMWAGFAVFWELSVVSSGAPVFFVLWGVPFVLMGAYITVGRFLWDSWQRAHTVYGLTDQRVLIVGTAASQRVTSLSLRGLCDISMTARGDGGTITLGRGPFGAWFQTSGWPGYGRQVPTLELAGDARTVHDLIIRAQASASGSQTGTVDATSEHESQKGPYANWFNAG